MSEEVTIRELEPGDRILWDDRSQPLEVQEDEVHFGNPNIDREGVVAKSQQGTIYILYEDMVGDPKVKRRVSRWPDEYKSHGKAANLRRAAPSGCGGYPPKGEDT